MIDKSHKILPLCQVEMSSNLEPLIICFLFNDLDFPEHFLGYFLSIPHFPDQLLYTDQYLINYLIIPLVDFVHAEEFLESTYF